jgi:N-acetylglucosaminyldiphosphoundecaprenol N-acetyl-beta-D-mannosaminyltransferase
MSPEPGEGSAPASRGPATAARPAVLGHPLDPIELDEAAERVLRLARHGPPSLVVTLNPEIVVRARRDPELRRALASARLSVADGVGVVWAARRAGVKVPARVPGVELTERVLEWAGGDLPVFFLGGRPGVAEAAAATARGRYGTRVAGARDGYFDPSEDDAVADEVRASGARLLLAGLGERQERFLAARLERAGVGAAIGVGGTLDVLAGTARRTPAWTRRAGLEWAWRVGGDPRRWRRAPRLLRFVWLALREG